MGLLEVNQIKSKLQENYTGIIDLSDVKNVSPEEEEKYFLTRALAAYSINILYPAVEKQSVVNSIVDGSDDNGIDLIFYNEESNELCMVQSKFNSTGASEPNLGEIQKFTTGVKDLINFKFDKFNQKVNERKEEIISILDKSKLKFKIVLAYTASNLSKHARREFEDLLEELNDLRNVADLEIINQQRIHTLLISNGSSRVIDIDVNLTEWGRYEGDLEAFYGQINATQLVEWWESYGNSLYDYNLRKVLGNTKINEEMWETLETEPELFWYYNNGVTLVCKEVDKKRKFGSSRAFGEFECKGISIVNGAQTVGVIGKYGQASIENKERLEDVLLPFRIISIEREDEDGETYFDETFAADVTTKNNRQNQIENRDFIVLDPLQKKIENDLAMEGITYHLMRSESEDDLDDDTTNLKEATRALAFASDIDSTIVVRREIGNKIFSDINDPRYKKLFNPSVTSFYVWNCVNIQRLIDNSTEEVKKNVDDKEKAILTYGKEIISKFIFEKINKANIEKYKIQEKKELIEFDLNPEIEKALASIKEHVESYDKSISNIFKSPGDMKEIYKKILEEDQTTGTPVEAEGVFDISSVENLSRLERLQFSNFMKKIQHDPLAKEFFENWILNVYDSEKHSIGYRSNIHFYLNEDKKATDKFIFRIAYYTKLIISFEINIFDSKYTSVLYQNQDFLEWAKEKTDDKNRLVVDNEHDLKMLYEINKFVI